MRSSNTLPEVILACLALVIAGSILAFASLEVSAQDRVAVRTFGPAIDGSGLPVPRFVSIKAPRANVRKGPSLDHPVEWVYVRRGVPVEIIAEFEHWRRIRDMDGQVGWIHTSLLDGRRTAVIAGFGGSGALPALHEQPETGSPPVALAEPGLITRVHKCGSGWCRVSAEGYAGWIEASLLWGVYNDETVE